MSISTEEAARALQTGLVGELAKGAALVAARVASPIARVVARPIVHLTVWARAMALNSWTFDGPSAFDVLRTNTVLRMMQARIHRVSPAMFDAANRLETLIVAQERREREHQPELFDDE